MRVAPRFDNRVITGGCHGIDCHERVLNAVASHFCYRTIFNDIVCIKDIWIYSQDDASVFQSIWKVSRRDAHVGGSIAPASSTLVRIASASETANRRATSSPTCSPHVLWSTPDGETGGREDRHTDKVEFRRSRPASSAPWTSAERDLTHRGQVS